jgi:hypothetical protein
MARAISLKLAGARGTISTARSRVAGSPTQPATPLAAFCHWPVHLDWTTPQGAGRIGSEGVGNCVGPGTTTVSAGLTKSFSIYERLRMQVSASFTNLLNHPNFAQPQSMDISSPSNFCVTQSVQVVENGGNRVGQLSLRLDF